MPIIIDDAAKAKKEGENFMQYLSKVTKLIKCRDGSSAQAHADKD